MDKDNEVILDIILASLDIFLTSSLLHNSIIPYDNIEKNILDFK